MRAIEAAMAPGSMMTSDRRVGGGRPRVQVCFLSITRHAWLLPIWEADLDALEQRRAARFHHEADRRRFLLGRAAIRRLGAAFAGVATRDIIIREGEFGKPCFEGIDLHFNLSHSGDAVVLAWSDAQAVGIDTEALNRESPHALREISRANFSAVELQAVEAATESELAALFFGIWTRKEAVLKAEGCGITEQLRAFSVLQWNDGRVEWTQSATVPGAKRRWNLTEVPATRECCTAVASPPGCKVIVVAAEKANWFPTAGSQTSYRTLC
jgi:phosphopantetheinyl transferase